MIYQWENGSREECNRVLRWLLLSDMTLQDCSGVGLSASMLPQNAEQTSVYPLDEGDDAELTLSPKLLAAINQLRSFFRVALVENIPLCAQGTNWHLHTFCEVEEPTAHDRLEAHLQLREWASARGLSFD